LPERYSVSVPPVTNNIYRSAAPAQNYLPERRSAAFRHHYSPASDPDFKRRAGMSAIAGLSCKSHTESSSSAAVFADFETFCISGFILLLFSLFCYRPIALGCTPRCTVLDKYKACFKIAKGVCELDKVSLKHFLMAPMMRK